MKHWKKYENNTVSLMCDGNWYKSKVVAGGSWPQANFKLDGCSNCGMEVTTTGTSPDTDRILEYDR